MEDIDRETIEHLRTWLSNRSHQRPNDDDDGSHEDDTDEQRHYHSNVVVIHPDERLRNLAFPDLHLSKFTRFALVPNDQGFRQQQQQQSPSRDTRLIGLVKSLSRFLDSLRCCRQSLETIEFYRLGGATQSERNTASFNVDESIELIQTCLNLDWALDIQISQLDCVLIDDLSPSIQDLISRICILLFASSPVRVVARESNYSTCLLGAFLVDLLHEAGVSRKQLQLLVSDYQQESSGAEYSFSWLLSSPQSQGTPQKQCLVAICFADTDIVLALMCIFGSYVRDIRYHRNLILLIEEANYDTFLYHWENSSDRIMPFLQDIDVKIDLNCIDIRLASRISKPCINVIKFRSLDDLQNLMGKLRKIPYIQIWSSDHIFIRKFTLSSTQSNQCEEFWLNQVRPKNIAGHRFCWQMIRHYRNSMKLHMDGVYTNVFYEFEEKLTNLVKRLSRFSKAKDRLQVVTKAYINLISKFKSARQSGLSVSESVYRLRRFFSSTSEISQSIEGESEIETSLRPIGLAILVIKNGRCVKSRSVLLEFVFKNLVLGNGVLLICPTATLGSRFHNESMKIDQQLPFEWIDLRIAPNESDNLDEKSPGNVSGASEVVPDETETSWDSTDSGLNHSILRKQLKCPKNAYAVEFNESELTSDKVDLLVLGLGTRRRSIWYNNASNMQIDE